jgi:hypothetical protein
VAAIQAKAERELTRRKCREGLRGRLGERMRITVCKTRRQRAIAEPSLLGVCSVDKYTLRQMQLYKAEEHMRPGDYHNI